MRTKALGSFFCLVAAAFGAPCVERGRVAIIAHRGAHDTAAENTLAALERAVNLGLDFVEIDVRTAADGTLVIRHNALVEGLGPWPTLEQFLVAARRRINLYLDVKQAAAEPIVALIRKTGMTWQTVVFGNDALVARVRVLDPKIRTMTPAGAPDRLQRLIREVRPTHVEFTRRNFSPEGVAAVRAAGITPFASLASGGWDTDRAVETLLDAGVCAIETDRPAEVQRLVERRRQVEVISHRGANRQAPENTLAAFRRAIELGAHYVEIDVRQTADGSLVLMHDPTVDRMTDGSGAVARLKLEELLRFRVRGDGPLPTLDEVFSQLKGRVKFYFDWKQAQPARVAEALRRHGVAGDVVFYGGPEQLTELKKLEPRARPMPEAVSADHIDRLVETLAPTYFAFDQRDFTRENVRRAHLYGARVFVDRLGLEDTAAHYRVAVEWGVDGIQTDYPDRLVDFLSHR